MGGRKVIGTVNLILGVTMVLLVGEFCQADTEANLLSLQERVTALEEVFDVQVNNWQAQIGDPPGAEKPDFDDSQWEAADVGYRWEAGSVCWFRRWIEVPQKVAGMPVEGVRLGIRLNVENGRIYVNGELRQEFEWSEGYAVLTELARPGDRFLVAVRAVSKPFPGFRPWPGSLMAADL